MRTLEVTGSRCCRQLSLAAARRRRCLIPLPERCLAASRHARFRPRSR